MGLSVLRLGLPVLLLALGLSPAWAHPHVWADVRTEVTVSAGYVDGVWAEWTFDDVFSQLILADHDADADGQIDSRESATIKKGYFDNLKNYRYFSHLGLGGKTLPIPEPQNFQASVAENGRVRYRFFLPLGLRLSPPAALAVSFYDDSFFTDIVFEKKNPVTLKATDGGKASFVLRPDKSKVYYGGQVTPTFVFITWSPS